MGKDEDIRKTVTKSLKDAVGQFRASMPSGDDMPSVAGGGNPEQRLKLAEYLLNIKEQQLATMKEDGEVHRISMVRLAETVLMLVKEAPDMPNVMIKLADVLQADGVILWEQMGDEYSISAGKITPDEGEELFISILPVLAEYDEEKAFFTYNGNHYLAYTLSVGDTTYAAIFVRTKNIRAFTNEEKEIGEILSEVIFLLNSRG